MTTIIDRQQRFRTATFVVVGVAFAASWIGARWPENLVLQHVPTVAGLAAFVAFHRILGLGRVAFCSVTIFILLHIVGARWIYSFVPYDEWSSAFLGISISDIFGFERNHFDRLVHFAFGLLLYWPIRDSLCSKTMMSDKVARLLAWSLLLSFSLLYEVFEWSLSMTLAPNAAEAYNGQQGDMWDAQKDMALATLGATISVGADTISARIRRRRNTL